MINKQVFIQKAGAAALAFFFGALSLSAQDDLLSLLDSAEAPPLGVPVSASFKSSRIINNHSLEITDAGTMDIKIQHRFGTFNSGAYNFWGLDAATIRIGAEIGTGHGTMIGFGRSSVGKTIDAYAKWKFMAQTTDNKKPISALVFIAAARRGDQFPGLTVLPEERISYVGQMILGRKFSDAFSLQIMPTWVQHARSFEGGATTLTGIGFGFRQKISPRSSVNAEYVYFPASQLPPGNSNPLSIGLDIETGGHVFQIHITNSAGMTDKSFLTETSGSLFRGDVRPGFNITRVFNIY
ncbi:MAG: hypothetical protein RL160_278 [Bacteroidota bacterium]|jgi:hypothetical protein